MINVYIGLGSNLNHPIKQLEQALDSLAEQSELDIQAVSSFYGNVPMGPADQPDYVNAVVNITTTLSATNLLNFLHAIEHNQNRKRIIKWGPRTIDLDILLYGHQQIDLPNLVVPHPGLMQRVFVVLPLLEIAPDLILPNQLYLKKVAEQFDKNLLTIVREKHEYTVA